MSYLGIDQSLSGTGLCLLSGSGSVLHVETVDPGKRRDAERLAFIRDRVLAVLAMHDPVVRAAFEGYSYDSVNKPFLLGELGGALRVALWEKGVPYEVVPPALVKKFATGNAHATKEMVLRAAQAEGFETADDNQSDAFFLASIVFALDDERMPKKRARIEVIHRIKNPKVKTSRRVRTLVKHAI